jgi:progressive ankylosis protein
VTESRPLTTRTIFFFWVPLAATWVMMALEGPFLAAIIARLADPTFNLAAYGIAFAFGILIEAPVIMLLSASTALVEDRDSYRKLRNFSNALNIGCTALLLLVLVPPVFDGIMTGLLGLPTEVSSLTYGALWILLPWPAAIGYRRFVQGLLIRSGRTRLVALGTGIRLVTMGGAAFLLYRLTELPGAWVGASAMTAGVLAEAIAARLMAVRTIRELMDGPELRRPEQGPLRYTAIAQFYYPLALTSVISLTVQPLLTFFMGRAPAPIESLAVFPVVNALGFLFRSLGLSFQEVAIALLGRRGEHYPELARFGTGLGLGASAAMALVAFTPMATFWYVTISGLEPALAAYALIPTMFLVPLPAMSVLLSFQRAVLVHGRATGPITTATALEVAIVAVTFSLLGWRVGIIGVTAAIVAFLAGRLASNLYLIRPVRHTRHRLG